MSPCLRTMHSGITELRRFGQQASHRRVVVSAVDYDDAVDMAYAMASRPGYEVTGVYVRI